MPFSRKGPPPRNSAADAYHCIMVRVATDPTEYKGVARELLHRPRVPPGSKAILQQSMMESPSNRVSNEETQKTALTTQAPYKACTAFTRVAARMVAEPSTTALCHHNLHRYLRRPPWLLPAGSDSCCVGFAPTGNTHLSTAHRAMRATSSWPRESVAGPPRRRHGPESRSYPYPFAETGAGRRESRSAKKKPPNPWEVMAGRLA